MDTLPVINRTYELYKKIVETNIKLEKCWRHSLGGSIEKTTLDLMSELIMAKRAPKSLKTSYLLKAAADQEILILKLRLFLEFGLDSPTKISQCQTILAEIGRMLGGWLKSLAS